MSKDETPPGEAPEIPVEVEEGEVGEAAPKEAAGAAAEAPAAPPPPTAEERLAALEKEKREIYDRLLRSAADLDNFRKRSRREADEARGRAREEVLREML